MSRDRHAVIWTRAQGEPAKLADMVLTATELRVTKTQEAIDSGLPGVSLLHDLAGISQFNYGQEIGRPLPPQLDALLPSAEGANPQRRILAAMMARRGIELRGVHPILQQWEMLLFAGRNGIGHLDVFANDEDAAKYYARDTASRCQKIDGSSLWYAFRRFVAQSADENEESLVVDTVGPTPGIAGFAPKIMTSIAIDADNAWNGDLLLGGGLPVVAKIEQPNYPGLLALEHLAYQYHDQCGFDVPRRWYREVDHRGEIIPLLAIERFDRKSGRVTPQESFFSLLHTGGWRKYRCNTDGSMESVARIFDRLHLSAAQKEEWYRRFVMAILTGNGDMHTENMAILGGANDCRLSPVYDPAPMRAYRGRQGHNILSALPFAEVGGVLQDNYLPFAGSGQTPPDLGERLMQLGVNIGIPKKRTRDFIVDLLETTNDYPEHAIEILERVPKAARKSRAPDIDGFATTLNECRSAIAAAFTKKPAKTSKRLTPSR